MNTNHGLTGYIQGRAGVQKGIETCRGVERDGERQGGKNEPDSEFDAKLLCRMISPA